MEANTVSSSLKPYGVRRRKDRLLQNVSAENGLHKKRYEQDLSILVVVLPPLAAVLCYLNGLDGTFVHDDIFAIKDNADVTGKAPLSRLLDSDFWGRPMCDNASHKSYRPVTVLTFRLNYYLGGGSAWQFHVVNVALHGLVTCLFGHLLRHVLHAQDLVTVVAALLFAVHPVHTEAVTGIVGRAELLSCIGVLLSLICYTRCIGRSVHGPESGGIRKTGSSRPVRLAYLCVAMMVSGLAMLCKEHGIMALPVCAVFDVFVFSRAATLRWLSTRKMDPQFRALCGRLTAIVCVGGGLMWFRLWMMCGQPPYFTEEDNPASFSSSWLTRVLTLNYLLAFNVWLLLCPRVLNYDWQVGSIPLITGLQDIRNLATLCLYLSFAYAGLICCHQFFKQDTTQDTHHHNNDKNNNSNTTSSNTPTTITTTSNSNNSTSSHKTSGGNKGQSPVLLVGLVLMAVPFLPSSNLFFRVGFVVAERVLYIPSTGFCLLVAHGAVKLWHRYSHAKHRLLRRCLIGVATALFILMAAKTFERNEVWKTRESLFRSGIQILPHNAKMHYNYANFLKDSGHNQQAQHHYQIAIRLYGSQPSYHNNLGTVVSDVAEAERCYRAALHLNPAHRGALVNLGNILINRNDSSGEQLLQQALSRDPGYMDGLLSLCQLEIRRGRWQQAEAVIQRALKIRPDLPDLHHYYGIVFHQTGQYEAAVASYRQAVSLDSKFSHAMTNAAASLRQLGRDDEAEVFLKRAVAATEDWQALEQLGLLYHRTGRTQEAINVYTQMVKKAPNDTDLFLNLVKTLMDNDQPKQAEQVLTGILNRAPHLPEVLYAMGHVQYRLGQQQQALAAFQEASRWVENNAELSGKILYEIGNVYKDLEMYPKALESYQASVAVYPAFTAAHHNLGVLYHILGQYEQALRHYKHVQREEPTNQLLLDNMAKLQRTARGHNSQQKRQPPS